MSIFFEFNDFEFFKFKVTFNLIRACWTPYVTIALWNQVNEESAKKLNTWIQELFFLLAVANSCVNGLVVYSIHM